MIPSQQTAINQNQKINKYIISHRYISHKKMEEEEQDGVHRLEGVSDQKGGLIVNKKQPTFKVPQASILGLDKLAAQKRKEKEEAARKMSFREEEDDKESQGKDGEELKSSKQERKFRMPHEETPTYTGGISEEARQRLLQRMNSNKSKEKGVFASTKDLRRSKDDRDDRRESDYRRRDRYVLFPSSSLFNHNIFRGFMILE